MKSLIYVKCTQCYSHALFEKYEGDLPTCIKCGAVGKTEKMSDAEIDTYIDLENCSISELFKSLKITRKRKKHYYKPY
jgi:hypothetical protein